MRGVLYLIKGCFTSTMGKAVHDLYGQKINRRHCKTRVFRQMYLPKNEQYRLEFA